MDKEQRNQINSLILLIAKGNEEALLTLYKMTAARLLNVAKGITGELAAAEDVVSEAFIRIVKYAYAFKRHDNGYGWICTITRNAALDYLKKNKRHANIDEFYNLADTGQMPDVQKTDINIALKRLDGQQCKMIWYKYYCDMGIREIAAQMNIPKSTVAYMIKKAEQQIKDYLV